MKQDRRKENELNQAALRYHALFEQSPDGILIIDGDGRILEFNEAAHRQLGYSREEFAKLSLFDLEAFETPDEIKANIKNLLVSGKKSELHVHHRAKNGEIRDTVVISRGMVFGGRTVFHTVWRDITEHMRAEDKLRKSEQKYRDLFENAMDAIFIVDADLNYRDVNKRAIELFGYSREEFLSMNILDVVPPEQVPRSSTEFEKLRIRGAYEKFEGKMRKKDGTYIDVEVSSSAIYDNGKIIGSRDIVRDVTGRRQTEEALRKTKEELEARVEERTRELAERNKELRTEIEDRRRMEEDMRHMAHHDALTGLPNRRLLTDIINYKLAEIRRNRKKMGVLFLDLDRFKDINDTLGHEAGDELLKQVAERLKSGIRESDAIARIGGDEFNVIVANISRPEDITPVARKMMAAFRDPFLIAGHEIHVTTSIGISVYPDDSDDINTLFRYADIAMYYAKDLGKNMYYFYNPAINVRSLETIKMENYQRQTLERGQLVVHYQPQVDIKTKEIVGAEALIRWQHPEMGLIDSKQFILIAEETGFITTIDQWVLRTACSQFKAWQDAGLCASCVAVNLSARAFQHFDLVNFISKILAETGLSPQALEIEITESTAMSDIDHTIELLRKLARMGVHISIDDFGTGYSSLNYLKRLPIQKLKIDQSFIKDISKDPDDRAIIRAVTAMAHNMKLKVVAEGVETEEQLSFLDSSGCDQAQGYFFHQPLPAERFEELVGAA